MAYKVGEVARLAHMRVRTLHHYDKTGLLEPSAGSAAGYRLYTTRDLERLQHLLFFRELGFGLERTRVLKPTRHSTVEKLSARSVTCSRRGGVGSRP